MRLINSLFILSNKVNNSFISLFFLKFKNLLDDYIVNYKIKYLFYFLFIYFFIFELLCFFINFDLIILFSYLYDLGDFLFNHTFLYYIYIFPYTANSLLFRFFDMMFFSDLYSGNFFGYFNGMLCAIWFWCYFLVMFEPSYRKVRGKLTFNSWFDGIVRNSLRGLRITRVANRYRLLFAILCYFFPFLVFFLVYYWARRIEKRLPASYPKTERELFTIVFSEVHTFETQMIYAVIVCSWFLKIDPLTVFLFSMSIFLTIYLTECLIRIYNFFKEHPLYSS